MTSWAVAIRPRGDQRASIGPSKLLLKGPEIGLAGFEVPWTAGPPPRDRSLSMVGSGPTPIRRPGDDPGARGRARRRTARRRSRGDAGPGTTCIVYDGKVPVLFGHYWTDGSGRTVDHRRWLRRSSALLAGDRWSPDRWSGERASRGERTSTIRTMRHAADRRPASGVQPMRPRWRRIEPDGIHPDQRHRDLLRGSRARGRAVAAQHRRHRRRSAADVP